MYQLYCSFVLPYLNYGLLLWGNANKECMEKVFKIQKRALRVISNSPYLSHSKPLFDKYKTLSIFDMYKKEISIFMYKYKNNMLPQSFDGSFREHQANHKYNTRNKCDYQLPIHKMKTILDIGPRMWNELPLYLKSSRTIGQFKRNLIHYLKGQCLT